MEQTEVTQVSRWVRWLTAACAALLWSNAGAADFNGDGKHDILWRNKTTDVITIWLMNGGTMLDSIGGQTVKPQWVVGLLRDFNGDGKSDILWRDTSTGTILIWLMDGDTVLAEVGKQTVGTDWIIQGSSDFNGDRKADILWRNKTSGALLIWMMSGGTILSQITITTPGADWIVQAAGDFNGDRKADILWRNNTTGAVRMWLMKDGAIATIPAQFELTVDKTQIIQGIGDFDGDHKHDILWRNSTTGVVTMWLMNGGTVRSAPAGKSAGLDWAVQDIQDFSGDRKADILWRNDKTGVLSVWLMNGGAIHSSGGGQTVASSWGVQTSTPPRISLAWNHGSAGEAGFRIERSPNGSSSWTQIGTTPANVTTYQDAGLAPFTTYYYRVRAYNAAGASTYSNVVAATTR